MRRQTTIAVVMIACSILVFFGGVEIVLRLVAVHLPIAFHRYLQTDIAVLAQRSKRDNFPHEYIAIFGDSYAQGDGDWYLQVAQKPGNGSAAYHTADIIFDQVGKDVVSFGRAGAGNFEGFVFYPIAVRAQLRTRGLQLEDPSEILLYFYEGNDLNDNLRLLERYGTEAGDAVELGAIRPFIKDLYARKAERLTEPLNWHDWLFVSRFLEILQSDVIGLLDADTIKVAEGSMDGPVTVIAVGGEETPLAFALQSPALELGKSEISAPLAVLAASLELVRELWPDANIAMLYVPSVLSSYDIVSANVEIQTYHGGPAIHDAADVYRQSDRICRAVAQIAADQDIYFVDARPFIQAAAKADLVHGPKDWKHFNRTGYQALAEAAVLALRRPIDLDGVCRSLY